MLLTQECELFFGFFFNLRFTGVLNGKKKRWQSMGKACRSFAGRLLEQRMLGLKELFAEQHFHLILFFWTKIAFHLAHVLTTMCLNIT